MEGRPHHNPAAAVRGPAHVIAEELREALAARPERLGLDPTSIRTVAPGAAIGRSSDGGLLRVDFCAYEPDELAR